MNRFYIGSTSNIELRMEFHDFSPANKFTGKAGDWHLFFKSVCIDKKQALDIEQHIKRMRSKKYIENLKKYPEIIEKLKAKYS